MPFLDLAGRPGETIRRHVSIGELADGSPIALPVAIARGRVPGPTVYIQAGIHGDELTGIEVARRFLTEIASQDLTGTVVCIPVANVAAHLTRTRGFLHEERWIIDPNRIFPGNRAGLLTERLVATLFEDFVLPADLTIDLHSALDGCDILPFASVDPADDRAGTLAIRDHVARAFGVPWVRYRARGAKAGTSDLSRSLGTLADAAGKALVSLEMGESRRVSEALVPLGVRALHNALRVFGVEPGEPTPTVEPRRFTDYRIIHTSRGGGLRLAVELGDEVGEGDSIGTVVDVFGDPVEELIAPVSGFALRVMRLGAVNTGAEAAWIGT